ncbi:hypothetical protein [Paenibacillus stellifer]|nr:hypothetical protein [Paenibacillus stellifer]
MAILVQSFVKRIEEIEDEINALSQLKTYVSDFLNAMTAHGITQISALPLLYDKVEADLLSIEKRDLSMETLNTLSDRLAKPLEWILWLCHRCSRRLLYGRMTEFRTWMVFGTGFPLIKFLLACREAEPCSSISMGMTLFS